MTDDSRLDDLEDELTDLRDEVEDLRARLDAADSAENPSAAGDDPNPAPTPTTTRADRLDHYDEPVVDTLTVGRTYHVRQLTQKYLRHSRISDDGTAKERVKQLVRSDGFTPRGGGDHEFTGWE
jgi:hypothetical protein